MLTKVIKFISAPKVQLALDVLWLSYLSFELIYGASDALIVLMLASFFAHEALKNYSSIKGNK